MPKMRTHDSHERNVCGLDYSCELCEENFTEVHKTDGFILCSNCLKLLDIASVVAFLNRNVL